MICPQCNQTVARLIIDDRGNACATCRGMSENGGARIAGILTRSSDRVRQQQQQFEGDMITPHIFDKLTNKQVPNPEFVAKYPEQLPTYFTESELKQQGYSKADKIFDAKRTKEAKHEQERGKVSYKKDPGNAKLKEVIKNVS